MRKHAKAAILSITAFVMAASAAGPALARHNHGRDDDDYWRRHHWHDQSRFRHYPHYRREVYVVEQPAYVAAPVYNARRVTCTDSYNPLPMVLGAGAGGVLGSTIGKGDGRTAAIVGGALLGGMLGGQYGQGVQNCAEEVFATAAPGTQVAWHGPDNTAYSITPTRNYQQEGRYCREYQSRSTIGGRTRETYGTACMQPDGSWEIIR